MSGWVGEWAVDRVSELVEWVGWLEGVPRLVGEVDRLVGWVSWLGWLC